MSAFRSGAADTFLYIQEEMRPVLELCAKDRVTISEDVDDICAAAFLNLFLHREKMTSLEHIRRWLHVAVRNATITHFRRQKKETLTLGQLSYLSPLGDSHTFEHDERQRKLFKKLTDEVNRLPCQRKTIIRLYLFERQTTTQIARRMRLSPQTILNQKCKAVRTLRRRLSPLDLT